jgi:hypothetical protein
MANISAVYVEQMSVSQYKKFLNPVQSIDPLPHHVVEVRFSAIRSKGSIFLLTHFQSAKTWDDFFCYKEKIKQTQRC